VSTLAICIVFVPVVLLTGPAKFLFTPMALAVVVAVLASYLLSRTIIPTLVRYLLAHELAHHETDAGQASTSPHVFSRLSHAFTHGFERLRERYSAPLAWIPMNPTASNISP
jgi:multidrug efflux pump subunit AcrB